MTNVNVCLTHVSIRINLHDKMFMGKNTLNIAFIEGEGEDESEPELP